MAKVLLKRGNGSPSKGSLQFGEVAANMDNRTLIVGDPDSEKGWHTVVRVVENTEGRLYAEVEDRSDFVPLYIKVGHES